MRQLFKSVTFAILGLSSLMTSTLSAWYDPTGYWGQRYPNCYDIPSRGKFTARAELLLLRAHIDNLKADERPLLNFLNELSQPAAILFLNDRKECHYNWNTGWKIGFGYACNDCWEADLNWTHFFTRAQLSELRGPHTHWKLELDLADLEIGKELWFNRSIRFKPHAGLRVARIYQSFESDIPAVILFLPQRNLLWKYKSRLKHDLLAAGPRLGFDFSWRVGCGFSFYVTGAGSWVWGELKNRFYDNLFVPKNHKDRERDRCSNDWTVITDFSAGIGWSDLWYNERRRLTFRVGYEYHLFIDQNKFRSDIGLVSKNHKNWYVQGIGGSAVLDF